MYYEISNASTIFGQGDSPFSVYKVCYERRMRIKNRVTARRRPSNLYTLTILIDNNFLSIAEKTIGSLSEGESQPQFIAVNCLCLLVSSDILLSN